MIRGGSSQLDGREHKPFDDGWVDLFQPQTLLKPRPPQNVFLPTSVDDVVLGGRGETPSLAQNRFTFVPLEVVDLNLSDSSGVNEEVVLGMVWLDAVVGATRGLELENHGA